MPRLDPLFWIMATTMLVLLCLLVRERRRAAGVRRAEREVRARGVVGVERARIAQELHEVVAHGVSVMTLGVGAGRMIMDKDPGRARETLRVAEESGRQALAELQLMLGLLSAFTGTPQTRAPQPRLADLGDLLGGFRGAGLRVELLQDGAPADLGPALELSAFRIVQEALTNTLTHAGAGSATVTLRWRPGSLDVLVSDDGRPRGPVTPAHGLLGMSERAALFGGTLRAEPGPDGGFQLRAHLPAAASRTV